MDFVVNQVNTYIQLRVVRNLASITYSKTKDHAENSTLHEDHNDGWFPAKARIVQGAVS